MLYYFQQLAAKLVWGTLGLGKYFCSEAEYSFIATAAGNKVDGSSAAESKQQLCRPLNQTMGRKRKWENSVGFRETTRLGDVIMRNLMLEAGMLNGLNCIWHTNSRKFWSTLHLYPSHHVPCILCMSSFITSINLLFPPRLALPQSVCNCS